uniref:Response regulator n=1 Tax=Gracilinema caldarium TaxID=215591 RepID=A0A7C3IJ35_9SPIR
MDPRKKILIVDDEQINLEFFDVMLSKLGFHVEKAENGLEALEKVRKFTPDLIILDNIMPKMSGWEVTKTIKNNPDYQAYKDIPIIMFSAMDDVKDKVEGFELGVDDYITKPYNFSEVLARIRAVLRNRELFSQIATRERQLVLSEEINRDMKQLLEACAASVKGIETAASQIQLVEGQTPDTDKIKKMLELIRASSESLKHQLAEMDAKIEKVEQEKEKIKKHEIELKTLEHQFRKSLHQE